jgi:PEP-CTERM motif
MKTNFKKTVILAGIVAALAFQGAKAQVITSNGDLIFGAEAISNGAPSGTNLEVDLGSISQFTTTATLTFANVSATDLASALGSGFATSSSDFFSVAGTTGTAASGSDIGSYFKGAVFLTLNQNPGSNSQGTLSQSASDIASLYSGLLTSASAPNSNGQGGELAASNPTSYSSEERGGVNATTFFNFSGGGSTSFGSGASLTLYALNTGGDGRGNANTFAAPNELGTISYNSATGLTFTGAAAVPEPSTVGLTLVGVALAFALKRRYSLNS